MNVIREIYHRLQIDASFITFRYFWADGRLRKIETPLSRDKELAQRVEVMELALRKKGKRKYFIRIARAYFSKLPVIL